MGQTPSTLNHNASQTTHTTSKSPIEQKYLSQNPTKFGSELDKFSQVQNLQYQSAPQTKQTTHLQTNLLKNNSKNLFGNHPNFGTYKSEVNSTSRNRAYNSNNHTELSKRRNSEDFEVDEMEENPTTMKENMNILDNLNNGSSFVSKAEVKRNICQKSFKENNVYENKYIIYPENKQSFNKSSLHENIPAQRNVLTVKKTNIIEETGVKDDEHLTMRKHTFGIENNNSEIKDFVVLSPEMKMNNNLLLSDEVRIMETGYSSSRKRRSENEYYEQCLLESQRFQENIGKSNKQSLLDSQKQKTPSSSMNSLTKQKAFIKKSEEIPTCKAIQNDEKKSLQSLLEDSENSSPVRTRKNGQGSLRSLRGFPNVEFSFKPNGTLPREFEGVSSRGNSSCKKSYQVPQSLRRSKSQLRKPSLPPIQILESNSSSYADTGHASTESASSPSRHHQIQIPQKKKLRTHSAFHQRTLRHQTRTTDGSMNFGHYSYTTKHHTEASEFHPQNYQPLYAAPIIHPGPPLNTISVIPPLEPYQYVNQGSYYGTPNYAYMMPTTNNPYFYQIPPQLNPLPLGIYHPGVQTPNTYGHNYPSPISKHPGHMIPAMSVRETPFHERLHSLERGSDTLRNYSNSYLRTDEGSVKSYKNLIHYEKPEYQALRSSKSLKNLRTANTPNMEIRSNRTKLTYDEEKKNENKTYSHGLPAYKSKNMKKDTNYLSQKNQTDKENLLQLKLKTENISEIGGSKPISNASSITSKALNDTTLSRMNEVSSRLRKQTNYQYESEGGAELNNTEYSIVQKLGGKGISNMNSLENNEEQEIEIKGTLSKIGQKDLNKNLKNNQKESTKIEKAEKMELTLGKENAGLSWEVQNLISNPTPNLPNNDQKNQLLLFDEIKKKLMNDKSKTWGQKEQKEEQKQVPKPVQKAVKMCFNFDNNKNDIKPQLRKSNGEEKSLADYFKQKKQSLFHKLKEENKRFSTGGHNTTKELDKSDLIQRRKDMMKSNRKGKETDTMSSSGFPRDFTRTPDLSQIGLSGFPTSPIEIRKNTDITVISGYSNVLSQNGSRRNTRELNASLMERLAHGQKQKLSKKEMVALTAKNYQNLPEVKNKKNDIKKKEEKRKDLRERQEKVKDLDARLRSKSAKRINTSDSRSYHIA